MAYRGIARTSLMHRCGACGRAQDDQEAHGQDRAHPIGSNRATVRAYVMRQPSHCNLTRLHTSGSEGNALAKARTTAPLPRAMPLPINPFGSTLSTGAQTPLREKVMKEPGLDGRHRDKDGAISKKHGNTLVGTLRKIYGKGFAAGYPDASQLSEVLNQLNDTSLSQLRRDHDTGHLGHKIDHAPK
jgi:hypothetical protein